MNRITTILEKLGVKLTSNSSILDFGCGAGGTVYSLLDLGYTNVVGYDVRDYLELRDPSDRSRFCIIDFEQGGRLPFEDNSFDLIISEEVFEHVMDQVNVLRELHRIMRPGGHALHFFPARYCLIEPHIYVPLGGILAHRWWYKLWALLGIRNQFQQGLSADETADRNAFYFVEGLNYIPNSCYEVVWDRLNYEWKWIDQECADASESRSLRVIGKLMRILPPIGWLSRTFRSRHVYLRKTNI
jgi:SAM-dependent methyltransferase